MTFREIRNQMRSYKKKAEDFGKRYGIISVIRLEEREDGDSPIFRVLPYALEKDGSRACVKIGDDMVDYISGIRKYESERIFRKNLVYYRAYSHSPLRTPKINPERIFSKDEALDQAHELAKRYANILAKGTRFPMMEETSMANLTYLAK